MEAPSQCPKCAEPNVYPDGALFICADCGHEWSPSAAAEGPAPDADDDTIRDSNGTPLANGDSVVLIKSLKLKGSSTPLKQGTKITNIRLASGDHAIDCKVDGVGIMLKQEFVRKV